MLPPKVLPPKVLSGTSLEVNDERYNATQIRVLDESQRYPVTRNVPVLEVASDMRISGIDPPTSTRSVQVQ
jgi:hypothetical protein